MSDEHGSGSGSREGFWLPILIPVGILVGIVVVLLGFSRILLAISHSAATMVALIVSAGIVAVAILVSSRPKVTNTTFLTMLGAVAGITMLAGGGAVLAFGATHEEEGEAVVVTIAAEPDAAVDGFSTDQLSFPTEEAAVLRFDNADPNIKHNVVIFDGENAEAPQLFEGEIVTGPAEIDYAVPVLSEGDYFFHCEVHPTTMIGVITAEEGGGGGPSITAEELKFDTDELDFVPGQETTLVFHNEDVGTPHNVAIYSDESLGTVLFQGEEFPGVATQGYDIPALEEGEYFFRCDLHPDMKGTVVVGTAKGSGGGGSGGGGSGNGEAGGGGSGSGSGGDGDG